MTSAPNPRWFVAVFTATATVAALLSSVAFADATVVLQRGGEPAAAVISGQHAYVGQGATVVTLGLSDALPPKVVDISDALPGLISGLAVKDDVLFASWDGIQSEITLFSLTDPAHPENLGDFSYDADDEPRELLVSGDTLFVADAELGLVPIDVTDPSTPVAGLPVGERSERLASTGTGHLITGHFFDLSVPPYFVMTTFDVSAPGQPIEAGAFSDFVRTDLVSGSDFAVAYPNTDEIWWLDDPSEPVSLPFSQPEGFGQLVVEDRLFLATADAILSWDLTDPWTPIAGPSVPLPATIGRAWTAAASPTGDRAMFFDDESRIVEIDTENPDAPSLRQVVSSPTPPWSWRVTHLGANLLVQGRGGLRLMDHDLQTLERYDELDASSVLASRGSLLMLGSLDVQIVDFSDPASPEVISVLPLDLPAASVWSGNLAWVATRDFFDPSGSMLATVDLSDPAHPKIVHTLPISEASDLSLVGSYLYLADRSGGLRIFDVSQTPPQALGTYDECEEVTEVEVVGRRAVFDCEAGQFHVVDVSDPANPSLLGIQVVGSPPNGTATTLLYRRAMGVDRFFIGHTVGVKVIDLSDPMNPVQIDEIEVPGSVVHMEPTKGGFWAAARYGGVARIQLGDDDGGVLGGLSAGRMSKAAVDR